MARRPGADAVYRVADLFRERCLGSGASLLWPDHSSWTTDYIAILANAFIESPDTGKGTFLDKLAKQLGNQPPDVHRIAADVVAFCELFPRQIGQSAKLSAIQPLIGWKLSDEGDPPEWPLLEEAFEQGIGHSGTYYQIHKPEQIAFYLRFAHRLRHDGVDPLDAAACKRLADVTAAEIKGTAAARHVLLHLLFPDRFERIASSDHKRRIAAEFLEKAGGAEDVDDALFNIRRALSLQLGKPEFDFYDDPDLHERWNTPKATPGPKDEPPPPDPSAGTDERESAAAARSAVEGFYPEPAVRHACLSVLADSIERAHAASPSSWGVTLRPPKRSTEVRLNVAATQACLLHAGDLYLVLDLDLLDAPLRALVDGDLIDVSRGGAAYPSTPFAYGSSLPTARLDELLPHLRDAHLGFVERAAREVRTRTGYYRTHSPGVIAYLREELGRQLPDPDYRIDATESSPQVGDLDVPMPPTLVDLAAATFFDRADLEELEALLLDKRQLVLEGPPGSGKTFLADRLARWFVGAPLEGGDDERVETVQFHQSYGYEDFVQGIRPVTDEQGQLRYRDVPGIFARLCDLADRNPDRRFVLIVDEINRGNLARIFGELLLLLEYREKRVRLPYGAGEDSAGAHLAIPANLYLIGTMNTTDRSLALIDYALRRRFYFYRLLPVAAGRAPVLERWLATQDLPEEERRVVLRIFLALNERIEREISVDFQVGHSYFMHPEVGTPAGRDRIWRRAVQPLLEEYFHGSRDRAADLAGFAFDRLLAPAEAAEPA